MKKIIYILIFYVFMTACHKNSSPIKYYYLIDISNPKIEINLFDSLENGLFKVNIGQKNIILGEFDKGEKTGIWYYSIGNQHEKVRWENYQCEDGITSLQYPDSWLSIPSAGLTFQATFDTIPHINSNYCFRIIRNKIIGGVNIVDYSKLLINDISSNGRTFNIQQSLVKTGNKEFVYSYLKSIRKNDTLLIMDYVAIIDQKYFDILYTTNNKNMEVKEQIFYDIISSIKIDNKKIINNLLPIKVFKLTQK